MVRIEYGGNSNQSRKTILRKVIQQLIEMTPHTRICCFHKCHVKSSSLHQVLSPCPSSPLPPIKTLRAFPILCLSDAGCMGGGDFPFI